MIYDLFIFNSLSIIYKESSFQSIAKLSNKDLITLEMNVL